MIHYVTDSLAEIGSSKSLIDKLKTLEGDEAQIRSDLSYLERQNQNPETAISLTELHEVIDYLLKQEPRQLLERLGVRVNVDREGAMIRGLITYRPP